jgi:hypothetical protein
VGVADQATLTDTDITQHGRKPLAILNAVANLKEGSFEGVCQKQCDRIGRDRKGCEFSFHKIALITLTILKEQ